MPAEPSGFTTPIHVVHGGGPAGALNQAIRTGWLAYLDMLVFGPCDLDFDRHNQLRMQFSRGFHDDLYPKKRNRRPSKKPTSFVRIIDGFQLAAELARFDAERSVLVWTIPTWYESLSLWWLLDAINRAGLDRKRFWIGEPLLEDGVREECLGHYPIEAYYRGFSQIRPLTAVVMRAGASLWRRYAGRSPVSFHKACRAKSSFFPEMPAILDEFGWFFPRLKRGEVRVRLSAFDQELFECLDRKRWTRPYDLIRSNWTFFLRVMNLGGDLFLAWRLHKWAAHFPENPVFEKRAEQTGANLLTHVSYRFTEHGKALRDHGLRHLAEAAPLPMGGWEIYDARNPFVRRESAAAWTIDRLEC